MNTKTIHGVAFILLVVGGLNWGLVGLFDMNLVTMLFGKWPAVVKVIYVLVGFGAVYEVLKHKKNCTMCQV